MSEVLFFVSLFQNSTILIGFQDKFWFWGVFPFRLVIEICIFRRFRNFLLFWFFFLQHCQQLEFSVFKGFCRVVGSGVGRYAETLMQWNILDFRANLGIRGYRFTPPNKCLPLRNGKNLAFSGLGPLCKNYLHSPTLVSRPESPISGENRFFSSVERFCLVAS